MFGKKCGAKARTNGHQPCRQPAMANGRCRLHGGKSPIKHGYYSKKSVEERRNLKELMPFLSQRFLDSE